MALYQLTNFQSIIKDGVLHIPIDSNNTDYAEYIAWLSAGNIPDPAPVTLILPDITGFIQAIKTALGGIVGANALAVPYPLFFAAVTAGDWPDVQALVIDAQTKSVINYTQYAAIKAAASNFNIPINLV